ncbi:MAG: hypothetical protein SGBAC_012728, partial [Bacillariaceae sp.]
MSMMESSTPATEALLRLLKQQEFESSSNQEAQRVNTPGSLEKRPRLHVLDMTSLLEASEQIEGDDLTIVGNMKLKTTAQVLEIVGPQEYSLVNKGPVPGINPLEAWSAPSHKRIFTADELYEIFSKECVAFLGDSSERRAADTLQILVSNRQNVSGIQKYVHRYKTRYQDHTRASVVDGIKRTKECFPGTIDNLFRATYENLLAYEHDKEKKKYQVIVGATGAWNYRGTPKYYTPKETREYIQQVISHLDKEIPDDVLFIWKTGVFAWFGDWNELEDNETFENPKGNNWLVHYANQIAKESILALNSTRRVVLDFAAEIAPYSWEHRRTSNNMAEFRDYVPWHLGPKARVLIVQMLAWEVARYRNSTLLSTPGIDFGKGIEFGSDSAQNSNDTSPGSEANEIASASSSVILDDDDDDKGKKQKTNA